MRTKRRNDPAPASIRAAPPLVFQRRFKATAATAADPKNRVSAPEARVLKFNGCRFRPPPPWRPVGDLVAGIVGRLVVVDDIDDVEDRDR